MENYLEHTLQDEYPNMDVDFLMVTWPLNGEDVGHVMIIVENDGVYYVNDPQTGATLGPFSTWEEVEAAVQDIVDDYYNLDQGGSVDVVHHNENPADNFDPPYFYEDPAIMEAFEQALEDAGVMDPDPYTPCP